jgi:pyrrolysine biosynthesis protein PylD
MTRLTECDIRNIPQLLEQNDQRLRRIACHALGIHKDALKAMAGTVTVGVVPFRSGQGIIPGFSQAVAAVVEHIGFKAFVTEESDVPGIAEAAARNASILMMADDHRFIALSITNGRVVDNDDATARGFIAWLDMTAGGLSGQNVLILGCGRVGRKAAIAALQKNAAVFLFDIRPGKSRAAKEEIRHSFKTETGITIETSLSGALRGHRLIVDATDAAGIIDVEFITPQTFIAAPGIPLGLTDAAIKRIGDRLLHDPLQTGVAVMAIDAALLP